MVEKNIITLDHNSTFGKMQMSKSGFGTQNLENFA
jgi:hypothetical protein